MEVAGVFLVWSMKRVKRPSQGGDLGRPSPQARLPHSGGPTKVGPYGWDASSPFSVVLKTGLIDAAGIVARGAGVGGGAEILVADLGLGDFR